MSKIITLEISNLPDDVDVHRVMRAVQELVTAEFMATKEFMSVVPMFDGAVESMITGRLLHEPALSFYTKTQFSKTYP